MLNEGDSSRLIINGCIVEEEDVLVAAVNAGSDDHAELPLGLIEIKDLYVKDRHRDVQLALQLADAVCDIRIV